MLVSALTLCFRVGFFEPLHVLLRVLDKVGGKPRTPNSQLSQ